MCGITGFVDFNNRSSEQQLVAMRNSLLHRGPDDQGHKFVNEGGYIIGLGHTRLSILEVSSLGHQPMSFKHLTIVFNGEVYNYKEISSELSALGHQFNSNSDTEVVLHAFAQWGLTCVHRFIGMFAFVIYDSNERKLYACRDRVGVKPFYYYWDDGLFLFGSELKSFHQHSGFKKKINVQSVGFYLQYGYVPGPASIFVNTFKLESGSWLIVDGLQNSVTTQKYWDIREFYCQPILDVPYDEAKEETERLVTSACRYRMVSDVPVGIFLSGGFDSSLVASILQRTSESKLKTFTIGFPDGINEAPFAEAIARHLGTDHTSYDCRERDAKAIIPDLAYYYDEPCADISTIPTILVSRLARKDVKVALSADGGDELFAGYDGFRTYMKRLDTFRRIPFPRATGLTLGLLGACIPPNSASLKRKLLGASAVLNASKGSQLKTLIDMSSGIPPGFAHRLLTTELQCLYPVSNNKEDVLADERNVMFLNSYEGALKDLLLVKVDRATMSAGLEGREPLLDHRLIEYAARLPFAYKHDGTKSKRIIRDLVYKYVDKDLMDRPKTGFDLPIFDWLSKDLAFLIDDYLDEQSLNRHGLFDASRVATLVKEFRSNRLHYVDIIWRLIHFQMWYIRWMN